MRIVPLVPVSAKPRLPSADEKMVSHETIICGALALALLFLAWRIAEAADLVLASSPP